MKEANVLHPLLRVVRCVCVCVRVRAPPGLPGVASNCLASLLRTCCLIESYTCYWQVQSAANRGQSSVWHWASSSKLNGSLCAYLLYVSECVKHVDEHQCVFKRETDVDRKVGVRYLPFVHLNASEKERKIVKGCWKCCCVLGSRERDGKRRRVKGYSCEMRIRFELI